MCIQRNKEGKRDAASFETMKDSFFFSALSSYPVVTQPKLSYVQH